MKNARPGLKWTLSLILIVAVVGFGCFSVYLEFALRRSVLLSENLPLTAFHLRRAGALIRQPVVEDIASLPAEEAFSECVSYASLLADGVIRVSMYIEPTQPETDWSFLLERFQPRANASDVQLKILPDMESFRDALQSDDVVLFFGHSNLGQGLNLHSAVLNTNVLWQVKGSKIQEPLSPKDKLNPAHFKIENMPKIESAVYIHLGCRSMKYYRDAFIENSSGETSFLLTHLEWAPGFQFSRAVDLLCQTLEKRQNVRQLIKSWEQLYAAQLLLGRSCQLKKYPDETHLSNSLFEWVGCEHN